MSCTDLVEVDDRLPEPVLHLVEVPHTHFTEVTGMVLVHVGTVVVLATGKTTTTWMLPVLADTTVTGRDVAATVMNLLVLLPGYDRSMKCGECRATRSRSLRRPGEHTACGFSSLW